MFYGATPEIFENAKELRNKLTETEIILWDYVSNNKLGVRFRRQHPIANYIADFYCHEKKLVVEIDGGIHLTKEQIEKDKMRDIEMTALGITVLRFTNDEVSLGINEVIEKIKTKLFPL